MSIFAEWANAIVDWFRDNFVWSAEDDLDHVHDDPMPGVVQFQQLLINQAQIAGAALEIGARKAENTQLRFLLSQAPMIEVPKTNGTLWAVANLAPFAYVNPKTLARLIGGASTYPTQPWKLIGRSPTKWVSTSLMPEDRVILTSNALPGLAKILTEAKSHA